ncbi:DUF4142 domain-containing protein [Hymenobacter glacialis]|uniref:DUF4142 domain-containing protein n=1 Tax=Hymenobacter glacialis TaxID=1908236 RepID=A0A1G1TAD8_9BACT|nr:DUF4142 domain-containing protein [Hymenobacter glacialis]OGX87849.1 hypothetical protein BEN48_11030 [Hymenobacter glacialis]
MKTMKVIAYLLVASASVIGTACSSTEATISNAGGTGSTAVSVSDSADATRMGTDTNPTPDANSGMANNGALPGSGAASSDAAMGTRGMAATPEMTAFMGTFATMKDPVFLMNAASSNLLEIQVGKLALQQASRGEVKQFAQMMVSHHTQATQELKNVASPLGVKLPQAMMPAHQAMLDQLKSKTGKDFDEAYMDMMETAHKMDVAMFQAKSMTAEMQTVKGFANRTLTMLRSHQTSANKIEKKVD